jgi:hypothetical protein
MRPTHLVLTTLAVWLVAVPAGAQQLTRNPHGKLSEECTVCHTAERWVPVRISASFDHSKKGFPLAGAHATTACRSCHASLDFHGAARDCASCHRDVHNGELGTDCGRCHTPRSFIDRSGMKRAHQLTRFPLSGSHLSLDCEACHTPTAQGRLRFVNTPAQCVECHQAQYDAAKDPDHVAGRFPQDCSKCHATTVWANARFNHDVAGFPLTGAHRAISCAQCHTGPNARAGTQCQSCHQQDYAETTNPGHAAAGFPTTCQTCHSTTSWSGSAFNHDGTGFPLTGAHRVASCVQCHIGNSYSNMSTACVSCHQQDYNTTTNPGHTSAGFPTTCETCHTTTVWTGATFNHTWFRVPHHGVSACAQCHTSSNYAQFDCITCHTKSRTDGDHRGVSGYVYNSTNCYACHHR